MAINPINHYSVTNKASIYDEEAMTALELAGRTAAKVNEAVNAFNDLERETGEHLTAQDQEIASRTAAQDRAIDEMITNTMPAKVEANVSEKVIDGTFDTMIDNHMGNLTERLSNLETNYTPGTTTADAELMDIRVDSEGTVYPTAGDAVRAQFDQANAINTKTSRFDLNNADGVGYLDTNGVRVATNAFKYVKDIPIIPGHTKITLFTYGYTYVSSVAYYDENNDFISGVNASENFQGITDPGEIPENARFVGFSFTNDQSGIFARISVSKGYDQITANEEMINRLSYIEIYKDLATMQADQVKAAYISMTTGELVSTNNGFASDFISVAGGTLVSFVLMGSPEYTPVACYDENYEYVGGYPVDAMGIYKGELTLDANVRYIRYAGVNSMYNQPVYTSEDQYISIKNNSVDYLTREVERMTIEAKSANPLYRKSLTATGDSITATVSMRPYASYARMIAADNDMTYECKAIWGATLASGVTASSGCILDTITTMNANADYVILSGGANDFYYLARGDEQLGTISTGYNATLDTNTFCGAVETLCKTAIERWKGKKILYVITHRMTDISAQDALQTHVATLIQILEKWGIPYVDLWHDMPSLMIPALKDLYTSNGNTEYTGTGDGLHPNEDGYRLYYVPRVEAKMIGI